MKVSLVSVWLVTFFSLVGCGAGSSHPQAVPTTQLAAALVSTSVTRAQTGVSSTTAQNNSVIGVDLRDLARFKGPMNETALFLLKTMRANPQNFFPANVELTAGGPTLEPTTQKNAVYGIEFSADPQLKENNEEVVYYNALYHSDATGFRVRSFAVQMATSPLSFLDVTVTRDIALNQTHFTLYVGLMQRKVILEDSVLQIKKIYPIAVGSFDEGVTSAHKTQMLTDKVPNAIIEARFAEYSRKDPDYFAGRPFVRIPSGLGGYTELGFHYSITPTLIRGFESHGCMRVRDKDLYELYYILKNQTSGIIPIDIKYWQEDLADSPYPKTDSSYFRVKNFGTELAPQVSRDENGLVILEKRRGQAPLDKIKDE